MKKLLLSSLLSALTLSLFAGLNPVLQNPYTTNNQAAADAHVLSLITNTVATNVPITFVLGNTYTNKYASVITVQNMVFGYSVAAFAGTNLLAQMVYGAVGGESNVIATTWLQNSNYYSGFVSVPSFDVRTNQVFYFADASSANVTTFLFPGEIHYLIPGAGNGGGGGISGTNGVNGTNAINWHFSPNFAVTSGTNVDVTNSPYATAAGTSATATNWLGVITAVQYGAVGDGITDDSVALTNAIAALNNSTNVSTLWLGGRTYNYNSTNTLLFTGMDKSIVGGRIVTTNQCYPLLMVKGERLNLIGLTVGGPGTNYATGTIGIKYDLWSVPNSGGQSDYGQANVISGCRVTNFWIGVVASNQTGFKLKSSAVTSCAGASLMLNNCDEFDIDGNTFGFTLTNQVVAWGMGTPFASTNCTAVLIGGVSSYGGIGGVFNNNDVGNCGKAMFIAGCVKGVILERNDFENLIGYANQPTVEVTNTRVDFIKNNFLNQHAYTNSCGVIGLYNCALSECTISSIVSVTGYYVDVDVYGTGDTRAYPNYIPTGVALFVNYHVTFGDAGTYTTVLSTYPSSTGNNMFSGINTFLGTTVTRGEIDLGQDNSGGTLTAGATHTGYIKYPVFGSTSYNGWILEYYASSPHYQDVYLGVNDNGTAAGATTIHFGSSSSTANNATDAWQIDGTGSYPVGSFIPRADVNIGSTARAVDTIYMTNAVIKHSFSTNITVTGVGTFLFTNGVLCGFTP